jgi:hypothetical protein
VLAPDLLQELAGGELLVVGEDGGAYQDALQDLVVVDRRRRTSSLYVLAGPGLV